ncbi:MAG: hypothetical protein H0W74_04450 [Sphingosinicella sp.]|nr:hypothetical protein [Sphingosinicella sp.]
METSAGEREKLARAQGVEEGLNGALLILNGLAEVMLERERAADPRRKSNHARRVRIRAYQVAAKRVQTLLKKQRRLLERLESAEDRQRNDERLRAAVEHLAL